MKARVKKWAIALTLLVALVVSLAAFVISDFRSANFDFTVRTGFSVIIGQRLLAEGAKDGIISVPTNPTEFGGWPHPESFSESINRLPPGDYRYVVYEDGGHQRFIVFNDEPELISAGFVPKDLIPK